MPVAIPTTVLYVLLERHCSVYSLGLGSEWRGTSRRRDPGQGGGEGSFSRPVKKRYKATMVAVISVPSLCLGLVGYMDHEAGRKQDWLIVNAYIGTAAGHDASWGGAIARWTDEFENALMYLGLPVGSVCTLVRYYCFATDFMHDALLGR
ncbi:uncharacterized protein BO66DRAFT_184781 [Aspergillus aculeatinus CBS 121060]|uniref:Uncharacterized protein n=1 Tax=Aspergillus aculeatinus CBS 121060 TaxID=1448322 RepID=A0ACD1GYR4_9EURO|nr:hypothetical protein BO66DRAFT_184781 [Aspergillus aculeatinus CBS 121060]RAH66417.1 hypothetical protein BO66DRAFT_184781 [Aspergillus aculeatinus CBS 121060]